MTSPEQMVPQSAPAPSATPETVWEIAVPLLSNRMIVGSVTKGFAFTALIMGGLLTFLMTVEGEFEAIPQIWLMTLAVCGGLLAIAYLVMLVVFRNRMRFRFSVGEHRILAEQTDTTARSANRLAIALGVLSGRPGTAGAGLIATSMESQSLSFDGSFHAVYRPRSRAVILRNRWRVLLVAYCTAENYDQVAARIAAGIEAHGTATRVPEKSPLPRFLGLSALVVIACVPSFLTVEAFDVSLLLPLLMMCFALAMIWFVGIFGYIVLGCAALQVGAIAVYAFTERQSYIWPDRTYVSWTVFSSDDWTIIVLTAVGLAVLGNLSLRAIRGRLPSVLESDFADMGE